MGNTSAAANTAAVKNRFHSKLKALRSGNTYGNGRCEKHYLRQAGKNV